MMTMMLQLPPPSPGMSLDIDTTINPTPAKPLRKTLSPSNYQQMNAMNSSFQFSQANDSPQPPVNAPFSSPMPRHHHNRSSSICTSTLMSSAHNSPATTLPSASPVRHGRSNSISHQFTPDLSGFNSSITSLQRKTPKNRQLMMPETPIRHMRKKNGMHNSIADAKLLLSNNDLLASTTKSKLDSISDVEMPHFDSSFTEHAQIGRGSFFDVYRVKAVSEMDDENKYYAIKRSQHEMRGRKDRDHYLNEAECLQRIGKHKNIVAYHNVWQEQEHFYIQLEYCPMNLSDYIRDYRRINTPQRIMQQSYLLQLPGSAAPPPPDVVDEDFLADIAFQISCGLEHIHQQNVYHLDIKPENILVVPVNAETTATIFKIADFGQARKNPKRGTDAMEGDNRYMAPELLDDPSRVTNLGPCDMFNLGMLLFELATEAELPQNGDVWQELRHNGAGVYLQHKGGKTITPLILQLLQRDPLQRPTASDVVRQLCDFVKRTPKNKLEARRQSTVVIINTAVNSVQPQSIAALSRCSYTSPAASQSMNEQRSNSPMPEVTPMATLMFDDDDEDMS